MPQRYRYLFKIDAFTPETIPLARLAEYMIDLAAMLGNQSQVHFVKLESGSTVLVNEVEYEAEPKVRERLQLVRAKEGPDVSMKAYKALNEKLREDNATAELLPPEGIRPLLKFPGRTRDGAVVYGPFNQEGTLDGVLIRIGGQADPVPVHLQEEDGIVHMCEAKRDVAIELAPFFLKTPIRASGNGRWFRDEDGNWEMKKFRIASFIPLKDERLSDALHRLRAIKGPFSELEDPLAELRHLRSGTE